MGRHPRSDVAGPIAVAAYVRAYGPATVSGFRNWLSRGLVPAKRIDGWVADLGDRLTPITVGGEPALILTADLDGLVATKPSRTVRLLGGFDQWVLGPGTDDPHVIAPARRTDVSRQSGWIAPLVVAGGVVGGTWDLDGGRDPGRVVRRGRQAAGAARTGTRGETTGIDPGPAAPARRERRLARRHDLRRVLGDADRDRPGYGRQARRDPCREGGGELHVVDHDSSDPGTAVPGPRVSSARTRSRYCCDLAISVESAVTVFCIVSRAATLKVSISSIVA